MFKVLGLEIRIAPSAVLGSVILVAVFTGIAVSVIQLPVISAILWAVVATLLYWTSEIFHQYGHAIAARRTGYPMTGVLLWLVFGASQYPKDEPALPAAVHIRRALGGAPMSIAIGVVFALLALLLRDSLSAPVWWLLVVVAAVNLLYFGFGAFVPLGFTDGSTLLYYRGKP